MSRVKQIVYKMRFVLLIVFLGLMWWGLMLFSPPIPKKVTIASGNPLGAYYKFAQQYRELFLRQGIDLHILETAGSVENISLLEKGEADIAFIQGGTVPENIVEVQSLASLYYEPLWVFLRKDLKINSLFELKGMKIAVGQPQSGTQFVALQLLAVNDVTNANSELQELSFKESSTLLSKGELDAAFYISSPTSPAVIEMLNNPDLSLMSFRRYRAYANNFLFIKDINLYEGTVDLKQNIPAEDKVIISTVATLAVRKDIHTAIVQLLLQTADKIHNKRSILEKSGEFPSLEYLELPVHSTATSYFKRGPSIIYNYLPFWLASLVYRIFLFLLSIITIIIPLAKILPALYRLQFTRKIGFWYKDLLEIKKGIDANSKQAKKDFENLKANLEKANVPLAFKKDLYTLQFHLLFLEEQLEPKKNKKRKK